MTEVQRATAGSASGEVAVSGFARVLREEGPHGSLEGRPSLDTGMIWVSF